MPRRGREPQPPQMPEPLSTATLAGASQLGGDGGSGMTDFWHQLQPYGGAGIVPMFPARELVSGLPSLPDLPADSLYADRPMRGGVQAFPAFDEYIDERPLSGGYRVLTNRHEMPTGDEIVAQSYVESVEWRDVPPTVQLCSAADGSIPTSTIGS